MLACTEMLTAQTKLKQIVAALIFIMMLYAKNCTKCKLLTVTWLLLPRFDGPVIADRLIIGHHA
ncbi:MAG: hypothetical protein DMF19_13320 [Verrucomicrobia bacterium]|nr:MAG: hypothetical protein DMF19_13320 [Verrucomicrobiota bacterium]